MPGMHLIFFFLLYGGAVATLWEQMEQMEQGWGETASDGCALALGFNNDLMLM